jgi:hypothetical protein
MAALNMRPYFRGQTSEVVGTRSFSLPANKRLNFRQPGTSRTRYGGDKLTFVETEHDASELSVIATGGIELSTANAKVNNEPRP